MQNARLWRALSDVGHWKIGAGDANRIRDPNPQGKTRSGIHRVFEVLVEERRMGTARKVRENPA
jgi:hypothetical protein